jgi:hypothetical protein
MLKRTYSDFETFPQGGFACSDKQPFPQGGFACSDKQPFPQGGFACSDKQPFPQGGFAYSDKCISRNPLLQHEFSKKFKSQTDTSIEYSNDINIMMTNISIMFEKISSRLESCEKKIEYLYNSQVKLEQEKIEQKIRDTEIFNSYIS